MDARNIPNTFTAAGRSVEMYKGTFVKAMNGK
jgi:hypothetical protein